MTNTPTREGLPEAVAYRHDIAWVDGLGAPTFSTKPPKPVNGPMAKCVVSETVSALYTADQMRAMYLAGIADARSAIPPSAQKVGEDSFEIVLPALTITITTAASMGWNTAVLTTLTNLTALEQEAKK